MLQPPTLSQNDRPRDSYWAVIRKAPMTTERKRKGDFERWFANRFECPSIRISVQQRLWMLEAFKAGRRAERPIKWMTFKQAVKVLVKGDFILAAHYPRPDDFEIVEFAGGTFNGMTPSGHILCHHGWSNQMVYCNLTLAIARIGNRKDFSFKGRRAERKKAKR